MIKFFSLLAFAALFSFTAINAQNFDTHQVKKGETIQDIANQYYVSPLDIYALNPDAKKELRPNTILIIPISKAVKPKSTVSRELEGFTDHRASRKETLYGIANQYHVSEEDIKKYNTFLYANTLQKGDKLQIPIFKTIEVIENHESTKKYVIQPKEGKWRVAYKFGISVQELEILNPNMGETLQEGQEINVPNIGLKDEKEVDERYAYYKVLPKEGFYRLKLKLGLEQDQLEALNPELKESGLKDGMILKIPLSKSPDFIEPSKGKRVDLINKISDYSTKHIALMLPFRLNRVDFDSIASTKNSMNKDPYLKASLDFHSGVLVALDSLKKIGISVTLDVYDTKYDTNEVVKIIERNNFGNLDAVIGPLTPNCFEKAASVLKDDNVPIISPIGTGLQLFENVFQSRPSDNMYKSKVINYIKNDTSSKNLVVISDSKNEGVSKEIKEELPNARQVFSKKNQEGKDMNYVTADDIRNVLKPGKNYVFLETISEGFASNVISVLNSANNRGNNESGIEAISIILVTTNFNAAFEGDEVNNGHLSSLQFTFGSASKMYDYNIENSFVSAYEKTFGISPNKLAVRGFDLTMDTVLRLATSKNLYLSAAETPLTEYVENKFAYKKKMLGGYYNDTVYLLQYKDLSVVEVE